MIMSSSSSTIYGSDPVVEEKYGVISDFDISGGLFTSCSVTLDNGTKFVPVSYICDDLQTGKYLVKNGNGEFDIVSSEELDINSDDIEK